MARKNLFLKRWLLQGIVVVLPLLVTAACLYYLILYTDAALWFICNFLPFQLPKPIFPGAGLILATIVLIVIGMMTESYLITKGISLFNYAMSKLPIIRTIYTTAHKIVEGFLGSSEKFSKVVMIEFPRKGIFTLVFKTSEVPAQLCHLTGEKMVSVFLPTTPSPLNGFHLMVPESSIIETELNPEEAFKLILSAGIINPIT